MKTTLDVPDSLYRQIKARAALKGQTIKAFFLEAIQEKLRAELAGGKKTSGWRSVFGKASEDDIAQLQQVLDEEFQNRPRGVAVILDTNAVSALLAGDKQLARKLATADRHHLPLIVIGEYQFGLLASGKRRKLQPLLGRLESESMILYADRETADWYATIRHDLKNRGQPIPENDLWIAALARQHALEIASQDPHFDHVDKLRRIGW